VLQERKKLSLPVQVRHLGYPGWTAQQLREEAASDRGLQTVIRSIQDPPLSVVILLAGTNDLGLLPMPSVKADNIIALHDICHAEEIPHTIAIEIPPSAYLAMQPTASDQAQEMNRLLKEYCENSNGRVTYFEFPFEYKPGNELWSPDGLHFSAAGYRKLGESLAPVVERILLNGAIENK